MDTLHLEYASKGSFQRESWQKKSKSESDFFILIKR